MKAPFSPLCTRSLFSNAEIPSSPANNCSLETKDRLLNKPQNAQSPIEKEAATSARYNWLVDIKDIDGNRSGSSDYDPRTLFIPPSAWSKFTPMEKQFWEIKCRLMDTVVFFKKGKFYELYESDADIGAQVFDLKMTDRVNMRMVGVPEASFDWWVKKFVDSGYRVARVDQTDTSISKEMKEREIHGQKEKIIKRELTCILTSGTLTDPNLISSDLASYCMAVSPLRNHCYGIAFVDASTACFQVLSIENDQQYTNLITLLYQIRPKEIILPKLCTNNNLIKIFGDVLPDSCIIQTIPSSEFWTAEKTADEINSSEYFSTWPAPLVQLQCKNCEALSAFGGLLWYLRSLKLEKELLSQGTIKLYEPFRDADRLVLDGQSLSNLDVLDCSSTGSLKGSLFGAIDRSCTSFGRRLLRTWATYPLRDVAAINRRLDTVELLMLENDALGSNLLIVL